MVLIGCCFGSAHQVHRRMPGAGWLYFGPNRGRPRIPSLGPCFTPPLRAPSGACGGFGAKSHPTEIWSSLLNLVLSLLSSCLSERARLGRAAPASHRRREVIHSMPLALSLPAEGRAPGIVDAPPFGALLFKL